MNKIRYPMTMEELNEYLESHQHCTLTTVILYLCQELRHLSNTLENNEKKREN
jgi:hypothetical protein